MGYGLLCCYCSCAASVAAALEYRMSDKCDFITCGKHEIYIKSDACFVIPRLVYLCIISLPRRNQKQPTGPSKSLPGKWLSVALVGIAKQKKYCTLCVCWQHDLLKSLWLLVFRIKNANQKRKEDCVKQFKLNQQHYCLLQEFYLVSIHNFQ